MNSLLNSLRLYKNNLNNNIIFRRLIWNYIKTLNGKIVFYEVGTAYGDSSTKAIYRNLAKTDKDFLLIGFEPVNEVYNIAKNNWTTFNNIRIYRKYFLTKASISFMNQVLPGEIKDQKLVEDLVSHYNSINDSLLLNNKELTFHAPNMIFIDSIRYSHVGILKSINELGMNNSVIIMEDDIPDFGEIKIIKKYFKLENVKKFNCFPHQWPFVAFNFSSF